MNRFPAPDRKPSRPTPPTTARAYPAELSRNLRVECVSRLAPSPAIRVVADATVGEAVAALRSGPAGCLLVTAAGRLVGIFTERDLLTRVLAAGRSLASPLRAVMTPDPVTVAPHDPIRTAVRRMQKGGYRHLPVIDEENRPVGVVSAHHILHYLVEHFPAIVFNQPPTGQSFPASPEGA